tara:strand:- start:1271 stop:3682 length:2412 start_codon:yes stop_codon:yes gene_type:complete
MKIKGYDEGGFLDDGASVDPISGNEVPTGSLQEEVRDDIPAKLSEGEFVVPADVVRFIGLDKLMKMRDSAKKGLASMEEEGQIGGSPAPDMPTDRGMEMPLEDDDIAMDALIDGMDSEGFDEQAMNFAEGGMPTYEEYTGRKFGEAATVEYRKYTNDDGDIIDVAFVRGKPVNPIPTGYYPVGSKPPEEEVPVENKYPNRGGSEQDKPDPYIVQHQQLSSDKVTRQRDKILNGISKDIIDGNVDPRGESNGMIGYVSNTEIAEQKMLKVMLPDAIELYEGITTNPNFLDKIVYEGKTDLEIMAATNAITRNARKASGKLDPGYISLKQQGSTFMQTNGVMPENFVITNEEAIQNREDILGKTPSLKGLVEGFLTGVIDFNKSGGFVGAILDIVTDGATSAKNAVDGISNIIESALTAGEVTPDIAEKIQKVDTVISKNVIPIDRRAVTPPAPSINQEDIDSEKLRGEMVQSPPVLGPLMGITEPGYEVVGSSDNYGSGLESKNIAGTPAPVDAMSKKERGEMVQSPPVLGPLMGITEPGYEVAGSSDNYGFGLTPKVDIKDSQLKSNTSVNPTASSAVTTGIPSANVVSQAESDLMRMLDEEDALGTTGTLGTTATNTNTNSITTQAEKEELTRIALQLGQNPAEVIKEFEDRIRDSGITLAESIKNDIQKVKEDKIKSDAKDAAANLVFARENSLKKKLDPIAQAALTDQQRRQQSQTTINSGGDNTGAEQRAAEVEVTQEQIDDADQQNSGRFEAAYGGLASKKRPVVKKMRMDNTSGLAAKKKAKQKAQAKKGALAAKRT